MNLASQLSQHCMETNYKVMESNWLENLATVKMVKGVDALRGSAAGRRAVVLGAGPSLDRKAMRELTLSRESLILIACDRAVKPMLDYGLQPDYVLSVEIQAGGADKMRGLKGLSGIPLVFDPLCCPETVHNYPGPLYTFDKPDVVKDKGKLRMGTAVVIYAIGLAEVLECPEIVLVGVDLAYPGGKLHADGVAQVREVLEGEVTIPSVTGGRVLSDIYFAANVEEIMKAASEGVCLVQTSPAGAWIEGASHASLESALSACHNEVV